MTNTIFGIEYEYIHDLIDYDDLCNSRVCTVSVNIAHETQFMNVLYTLLAIRCESDEIMFSSYYMHSHIDLEEYGLVQEDDYYDDELYIRTYIITLKDLLRIIHPDATRQYINKLEDELMDLRSVLGENEPKSARAI